MKIKENGNEIPIRKSITDLAPQGLYNPISVSKDINDKAYIKFDENFLKNNVKSSTLLITQNGDKSINIDAGESSLSAGDGLVSDGNTISIDAKKFVDDISINGKYTKWSASAFAKVDLNDTAKAEIEATKVYIYTLVDPLYSFYSDMIIDKFNENINADIPKLTIVNYNSLYLYPIKVKSSYILFMGATNASTKMNMLYLICQSGNKPTFLKSEMAATSVSDPTTL